MISSEKKAKKSPGKKKYALDKDTKPSTLNHTPKPRSVNPMERVPHLSSRCKNQKILKKKMNSWKRALEKEPWKILPRKGHETFNPESYSWTPNSKQHEMSHTI